MVQPDLSRPTWLGYIPRRYTRPKTVTHPSTNRDQCTVTSFMRQTTLLPPTVCVSVIALQNGFSYQHQRYSPQQLEVIDNTFHLDYSFNQTKGHCRTQIGSCSFYSNAMMCRLLWWPEMPKICYINLLTYLLRPPNNKIWCNSVGDRLASQRVLQALQHVERLLMIRDLGINERGQLSQLFHLHNRSKRS